MLQTQDHLAMNLSTVFKCPKCEADKATLTATADSDQTLHCSSCNSSYTRNVDDLFYQLYLSPPVETQSFLTNEEDELYIDKNLQEYVFKQHLANLRDILTSINPQTLIDIGCGSGAYATLLEEGYQVYYGLEPSQIPSDRKISSLPNKSVFLAHYNPSFPLPIQHESADCIMFIASYDHIADRQAVIQETWSKLKVGGRLLITMTNYQFWLKTLLNSLSGKRLFLHEGDHYCTHSPQTLIEEIQNYVPDAKVEMIKANYIHVPRLPKALSLLYFSESSVMWIDQIFRLGVEGILRQSQMGSQMAVLFNKSSH